MFTKRILRVLVIAAVTLLALNISPGTAEKLSLQPLPAPAIDPTDMGSAFTYQGRLLNGTSPANGVYDFRFRLYDDATAGTLLGTVSLDNYTVTNGLFMADLDYGAGAFTGYGRWLEIAVKPDAIPGYTSLSPRQKLNPAPYATFARTIYRKTLVVKPAIPDDPLLNGQTLLDTIGSITDASASYPYLVKVEPGIYDLGVNAADESRSLQLVPYVDLEGSGEGVTIIRSGGYDSSTGMNRGTVIGASNVEVRSLTIESDGNPSKRPWYSYAVGVYVPAEVDLRMTHVTVKAYDAYGYTIGIANDGVYIDPGPVEPGYFIPAILTLDTVRVFSTFDPALRIPGDNNSSFGIFNDGTSQLTMTTSSVFAGGSKVAIGILDEQGNSYIYDSEIVVKGMDFFAYIGIENHAEESSLYMRNSKIVAGADSGVASSYVNGILNVFAGPVQLIDSEVLSVGADAFQSIGINVSGSSGIPLVLNNVKVEASGSNASNYGIASIDSPLIIRDSHIYAHDGNKAAGLWISDNGAPSHEITQTEIKVEGADLSLSSDPKLNGNIGVYIWSDGNLKFIRDSIWVPDQDSETIPVGGVGIVNDGGQVVFENGTIGSTDQLTFIGIAHYVYAVPAWNTLYVNNSEIYSCVDPFSSCTTVITLPGPVGGNLPQSPVAFIGSTLLWGNSVSPGMPVEQCAWVHDDAWGLFPGPACP